LAGWVVLSKTSKARLEHYGIPGHRIRVAYPFQPIFDGSSLHEAVDERRPTVLFVGWLNELRGLHVAVEAMAELVKEVPDARLMAVGSEEDTRYVARIKDMIKAFQLESNIQLLGKQKNEAVMQLIAESSAVVVPLQWPNEFGPVILVEAMALAKPIVASRVGAIPEFVEDGVNAFLVAPDQPKQFADKLRLLLTNKELAQAMGKKAQSSARLLCEEPTAKMVELYRSVAAHKKGITKVASVL
jgi:glycosyltransferase involved in cell wall biosynthesis